MAAGRLRRLALPEGAPHRVVPVDGSRKVGRRGFIADAGAVAKRHACRAEGGDAVMV